MFWCSKKKKNETSLLTKSIVTVYTHPYIENSTITQTEDNHLKISHIKKKTINGNNIN